jgi:hypothetical protein
VDGRHKAGHDTGPTGSVILTPMASAPGMTQQQRLRYKFLYFNAYGDMHGHPNDSAHHRKKLRRNDSIKP